MSVNATAVTVSVYNIVSISVAGRMINISGDHHLEFISGVTLRVKNATNLANNGLYTVASCTYSITTHIIVNETIAADQGNAAGNVNRVLNGSQTTSWVGGVAPAAIGDVANISATSPAVADIYFYFASPGPVWLNKVGANGFVTEQNGQNGGTLVAPSGSYAATGNNYLYGLIETSLGSTFSMDAGTNYGDLEIGGTAVFSSNQNNWANSGNISINPGGSVTTTTFYGTDNSANITVRTGGSLTPDASFSNSNGTITVESGGSLDWSAAISPNNGTILYHTGATILPDPTNASLWPNQPIALGTEKRTLSYTGSAANTFTDIVTAAIYDNVAGVAYASALASQATTTQAAEYALLNTTPNKAKILSSDTITLTAGSVTGTYDLDAYEAGRNTDPTTVTGAMILVAADGGIASIKLRNTVLTASARSAAHQLTVDQGVVSPLAPYIQRNADGGPSTISDATSVLNGLVGSLNTLNIYNAGYMAGNSSATTSDNLTVASLARQGAPPGPGLGID